MGLFSFISSLFSFLFLTPILLFQSFLCRLLHKKSWLDIIQEHPDDDESLEVFLVLC